MDNITHSLAGLLLAEAAVRLRAGIDNEEPSSRFRAIAGITSVIAANLPDADLLYTGLGGDRLRYMLHHRGYSHTVLGAVIGALVLWGAAVVLRRWSARERLTSADQRWLLGLLFVSTFSHLVLDWTNSYGIHPFWPIDDRWRYGDAVFIVEPWFWVVSVPALFLATARRSARVLLALVLVGGVALSWRVELVTRGAALALTGGAVLSVLAARLLGRDLRVALALAGWLAVTLAMMAGTTQARSVALGSARMADPSARILDVVVSPLPSNALCATVITVEQIGTTYRVAVGRVSAAPRIVTAAKCGARVAAGPMLAVSSRRSTPAVNWDGEWNASSTALTALAHESCPALAALRFIRVPIWSVVDDSVVAMGDVRYGGASDNSFTSVHVPRRSTVCPKHVPPWTPPRTDLLEE